MMTFALSLSKGMLGFDRLSPNATTRMRYS